MTRANRMPVVGPSHRADRRRSQSLAWYGLRIAVGSLGRVCAYGLLCMVALDDWRWFGLGIVIVAFDELARP